MSYEARGIHYFVPRTREVERCRARERTNGKMVAFFAWQPSFARQMGGGRLRTDTLAF